MLFDKFAHRRRAKISIDSGTAIKQSLVQAAADGTVKPVIYYVGCESAFRSFQNYVGKIFLTNLAVQPFARTVPHLEISWQAFDIFDNPFIHERNTKFKAMRHGELVRVH